ncbi:transporter [Mycobacterium sp. SWH-M5]|nr:transporter [Mycobacterium sp. SWH-M5]
MRAHRTAALAGLCVIEFLSWGVLYYTLPVIGVRITAATGWPPLAVPVVYTTSLLCAAFATPWAGRMVDRHGPRPVMTLGSLVGACALVLAGVTAWLPLFAAAFLIVGVAQAGTLYPPAFAAATQWFGTSRTWPLTAITLVGGVSSTAFAPLTAALDGKLGWQSTLVVLGIGYGLLGTGAAVLLLSPSWRRPAREGAEHAEYVNQIVRSAPFRYSRLALAITALGLYAVTLNVIPLLTELGFGYHSAAIVFGLIGAGQVFGRVLYLPLRHRGTPRARTTTQVAASTAGMGILAVVTAPLALVASAAMFAGAARGTHTLSVATAITDRWGAESYATILGHFHRPIAIAMALGPAAGSAIAAVLDSYRTAAAIFAALGVLAILTARRS